MEESQARYKAREIKLTLAQIRQRPIPTRTWEFWKARLHIRPDTEGFYTEEDFKIFKGLIKALGKGWTIKQYIDWHNTQEEQKEQNNANRQGSTTERDFQPPDTSGEPIEVPATAC